MTNRIILTTDCKLASGTCKPEIQTISNTSVELSLINAGNDDSPTPQLNYASYLDIVLVEFEVSTSNATSVSLAIRNEYGGFLMTILPSAPYSTVTTSKGTTNTYTLAVPTSTATPYNAWEFKATTPGYPLKIIVKRK